MQEYEYLNTSEEDFILVGNIDAFSGIEKQTDAIIKVLSEYYGKLQILKILRNYIMGYEIGLIEKRTTDIGMIGIFDYKTGVLKIEGKEFDLPFDKEYSIIKTESMQEAKRLLNIYNIN